MGNVLVRSLCDQYNVSSTMRRTIMADKKVNDAAWTLLTSFQEANRIVAEHLVASQERSRKLAEEFFTEGMEVLRANQQAEAESGARQAARLHHTQRLLTE